MRDIPKTLMTGLIKLRRRPTKSVLYSYWLLEVGWIGLSGSIHSHDSEAVQSTFIQVDHLKLGLLARVWSVVHLWTAARVHFTITS